MSGDPQWAIDAALSNELIWEQRSKKQLERARKAEAKVAELEKQVYDLKGRIPLSSGANPEEAARAFAEEKWPGETVDNVRVNHSDVAPTWRVRCHVDGTSMKIDGRAIPGGHVVTGWR